MNDRPDSMPMLAASDSVLFTMMIPIRFGIICVNTIFRWELPSVFDALMYSSSFSCMARERTSRAVPVHRNAAMMSEKVNILYDGEIVTNTMMTMRNGSTMKKSTTRI